MKDVEFKIDAEPKNNYENAKKLLLETDNAIQLLSPKEQQMLAKEFLQYKGMYGLYRLMEQNFG